jgi:chaperonin GroES
LNEYVEPLGKRIVIRKDAAKQTTRGGIVLPDQAEIPTITGRVVATSVEMEKDEDFPVRKYDKVLFHPRNAIPVDLEPNNVLYVVPVEDVVAVFRRVTPGVPREAAEEETAEG